MAALNKRPHPMAICHEDVAVEKVLMDCRTRKQRKLAYKATGF